MLKNRQQIGLVLYSCVIFILIVATFSRNRVWKTEYSLWSDAVRRSPQKARTHFNLAVAAYSNGLTELSLQELELANMLDPSDAATYQNLGFLAEKRGAYDEALGLYEKGLSQKTDSFINTNNLYMSIASLYSKTNRLGLAVDTYKMILQSDPGNYVAINNLSVMYLKLDRTEEAISLLRNVLQIHPEYADGYYNLGNAYLHKKDIKSAIGAFENVLELNPLYPNVKEAIFALKNEKSY